MFSYTFQLSKKVIFEIDNGEIESNPYFATSAAVFNQPKTDFERCGQCQEHVLTGKAREFWEKWDKKHLCHLTQEEEREAIKDIEELKKFYNWIDGQNFYDQKELSKMEPKMAYEEKKAQARQMGIDWQNEQAKKSSSYAEMIEQAEQFRKLAKRYGLTREFVENGII